MFLCFNLVSILPNLDQGLLGIPFREITVARFSRGALRVEGAGLMAAGFEGWGLGGSYRACLLFDGVVDARNTEIQVRRLDSPQT